MRVVSTGYPKASSPGGGSGSRGADGVPGGGSGSRGADGVPGGGSGSRGPGARL
jgi:hypothetical protein